MGRLAGSIILLSGWRRTLVAILAGAVAVLGQAPYDFPAACFVAFPVLVWLLDGSAAAIRPGLWHVRERGYLQTLACIDIGHQGETGRLRDDQ